MSEHINVDQGRAISGFDSRSGKTSESMGSVSTGAVSSAVSGAGSSVEAMWQDVLGALKQELGATSFESWIAHLNMVSMDESRVTLSVESDFLRDWIRRHYMAQIEKAWAHVSPQISQVDILISDPAATPTRQFAAGDTPPRRPTAGSQPMPSFARGNGSGASSGTEPESSFGAPLDERYTFENFVVGKSNELAHAAARRVAEADDVPFNPLFLYGSVGLGKTHLMHAIANEIRRRDPLRKVLYLSAEKFMYQFIRAVRYKDTMAFKDKFRSVDVLMVDDVQFISGKESTQEEFFHTFNALIDHNRQVILTADRPPVDLDGIEERIRSRLGWGLSADIHATDYELRFGILQSKLDGLQARGGGVAVPGKVLEFLAHKIVSNVRELEGALNRVVAYADLVGRPVSLEMAEDVLSDLLRANERRITIDDIQRKVAEYYNLRLSDLLSARRARVVARPRQVAMYLSKQLTTRSLPEIGRKFGGRDHTTVMHAVRKIDELKADDIAIREDVEMLERMLKN